MTDDPQARLFPATGMPDRDWWHLLWPDPRETLSALGVRAGLNVVDLCCGDGYFTVPLAQLAAPGTVVAIDLLPEMVARAVDCAAHSQVDNISFLTADVRELATLVKQPVDLVLIANTFHGVPDKTELARAVRAVLAPEGRFVVVNWYRLPREQTQVLGQPRGPKTEMRMAPEQTAAVVVPGGFRLLEVLHVGPFHYGAVFAARG